jgi:hypothetical protein
LRYDLDRFNSLRYSDVIFFNDRIELDRVQEVKARLTDQAFGAWLSGAGDKKTFAQFLSSLGLGEKKEKPNPEKQKEMIEKSNAIADRILGQMKKKGRKNGKKNI